MSFGKSAIGAQLVSPKVEGITKDRFSPSLIESSAFVLLLAETSWTELDLDSALIIRFGVIIQAGARRE